MAKRKNSTLSEWQRECKEGGVCEYCGEQSNHLTIDHIVPKNILETIDKTGEAVFEDTENFAKVCPPCNRFKGAVLDIKNPKTKLLLKKYLDL
jgi:5-methylcytosine-specific restriction endonuclease McrA